MRDVAGGCVGCPVSSRPRWGCPDLPVSARVDLPRVIPGSSYEFDDCPAYYLRTADMDLPADHLLNGVTHPAELVRDWAFEIQNGARNADTLSPKARDAVHVWFSEESQRREREDELRQQGREKARSRG